MCVSVLAECYSSGQGNSAPAEFGWEWLLWQYLFGGGRFSRAQHPSESLTDLWQLMSSLPGLEVKAATSELLAALPSSSLTLLVLWQFSVI